MADSRQVAVVWGIEDVQHRRPDLTADQSWEVLQRCRSVHDCTVGFTLDLIDSVTEGMFPAPKEGAGQ